MTNAGTHVETGSLKDLDRLREIAELDLDCPEVDEILESIIQEAAEHLDLPIGVVSIVLDEAQYFKAMFGVDGWSARPGARPSNGPSAGTSSSTSPSSWWRTRSRTRP